MFRKIWIVLWKNLTIRRRYYVITPMEILFPTLLFIFVGYINLTPIASGSAATKTIVAESINPETPDIDLYRAFRPFRRGRQYLLAYTPAGNSLIDQVMEEFKNGLPVPPKFINCTPFSSESEILNTINNYNIAGPNGSMYPKIDATIIFELPFKNGGNGKIAYTIRMPESPDTGHFFSEIAGPRNLFTHSYISSGFTVVQIHLDKSLLKILTNVTHEISTQIFPYPTYTKEGSGNVILQQLTYLIFFGFFVMVPSVIVKIVGEKQTGIKELMKMMGLPSWIQLFGWMLDAMCVQTIIITIVTVLLFFSKVIVLCEPTVVWVVLFLYMMSSTAFCFFISSLFQKSTLAVTVGVVVWPVTYFSVVFPFDSHYISLSMAKKLSAALFPNMALHLAVKSLYGFEAKGDGARWNNITKPLSPTDSLRLLFVFLMMIFDTVLYTLLALYMENVLPSEFGLRKPWYFIFKPSTWWSSRKVKPSSPPGVTSNTDTNARPGFEGEPVGLVTGVEVQNLRKTFGSNKVAVDGVTFKIYEGEITALLGHNGAGKTTTISMLSGMTAPTSGTALICGKDIKKDVEGVRKSLGLCPQNDMLFDKLTVAEHLKFFGMLKGKKSKELSQEITELLNLLKMTEKKNVISMKLSGGQKRRLCLANSLIGGSKVVILDECTSGLDPEARREVWDILLAMRGQRTIILTTHFMEEADILGDRIIIMADGKVQCNGTADFLKKFYGCGYTLSMTVTETADRAAILEQVQKSIPDASFKLQSSQNPCELTLTLPTETATSAACTQMLKGLSDNKGNLEIQTIGLALTTMDEVFVKVGELSHGVDENTDNTDAKPTDAEAEANNEIQVKRKLSGCALIRQQFWALLIKRALYTKRNKQLLLSQILLPLLIFVAAILLGNAILPNFKDSGALTMLLDSYDDPITLFSSDDTVEDWSKDYKSVVGSSAKRYNGDVVKGLLDVGYSDIVDYRQHYIIAANITPLKSIAMFSSLPYHASPLSVNMITNTLLKHYKSKQRVEVASNPLKDDIATVVDNFSPDYIMGIIYVFTIFCPLGMGLLSATYIIFPAEERLSKAKQLQMMTGLSPIVYWCVQFVWDILMMLILIGLILLCTLILQHYQMYTNYGGAGLLFLTLLAYGFATIPFSYLCSLVFTGNGGFVFITVFHFLMVFIFFVQLIMDLLSDPLKNMPPGSRINPDVANTFAYLFYVIFPTYGLPKIFYGFVLIVLRNNLCHILLSDSTRSLVCKSSSAVGSDVYKQCCGNNFKPDTYITWDKFEGGVGMRLRGNGEAIFFMVLFGFIYIIILMLLELGVFSRIRRNLCKTGSLNNSYPDDEDVIAEADRVATTRASSDAIVVENLSKSYGSFAAVANLTFGVHYGECFGLLGVNGAGKTTTFRMLTGDEYPSSGNAYTGALSLNKNPIGFVGQIGYCPQFDATTGVLTGKEMLQLFCRLRGTPSAGVKEAADQWLDKLGLTESANVQSRKYSGGMKRRLSAGVAMIGDPPIILLDEPTSGVDPISRRQFWKIIESVKKSGQAVILTSHSMEECEALCSRLGIMVNGQLQCFGGVQHLKSKFAQGYTVSLKLKSNISKDSPEWQNINNEITTTFDPCTLKDQHLNVLKYQVLNTEIPWDVLFESMEAIKNKYEEIIEEYSVSETTLEEVFISFARKQYGNRSTGRTGCKACCCRR